MLKRDKQHTKLNNKGMTLVELVVSVTILVLVAGFILSAFVSAMRTSKKSRDLHRATTVAQNIMEGINLKSAEELAYQFNYPILQDSSGADVQNFTVYLPSMLQYSAKESVGELYATTNASGDPILAKVSPMTLAQYKAYDVDPVGNRDLMQPAASAYMSSLSSDTYDFLKDTDGKYYYYTYV